jgi:hypothetical protein
MRIFIYALVGVEQTDSFMKEGLHEQHELITFSVVDCV